MMEQRRLFAVPGFPGNLAVFIPGNSGMKKSGNPGRPGNGRPGMKTLASSKQHKNVHVVN